MFQHYYAVFRGCSEPHNHKQPEQSEKVIYNYAAVINAVKILLQ